MDQEATTCSTPGEGIADPLFKITANSFKELDAKFRAYEAIELRRLYHEEQNRLFDKMSKKRQRLTIAKDVLDQLAAGKIKAKRGTFVDRFFSAGLAEQKEKQLSEALEEKSSCSVCALGGMFVCAVKRLDKLTVGQLGYARTYEEVPVQSQDVQKYLGRCFDAKQLQLIEIAFEGGNGAYSDGSELGKRAKRYCRGVSRADDRMRKIMRNIIRNDGKFIP